MKRTYRDIKLTQYLTLELYYEDGLLVDTVLAWHGQPSL